MDEDVDRAERLDGLGEEPLHVQLVRDIGTDGDGRGVASEERLDRRLCAAPIMQVVDDNGVAAARQNTDDRPADAA
jgi:hypothetical protein